MTFDSTNSDLRNATVSGSEPEKLSQTLYNGIDSLP